LLAGIEPSDAKDMDNWYRKEHLDDLAKTPSYVRSRRYKLSFFRQNRNDKVDNDPPTYLALHEYSHAPVESKVLATADTPWAKKVMGTAKTADVGTFKYKVQYGEKNYPAGM